MALVACSGSSGGTAADNAGSSSDKVNKNVRESTVRVVTDTGAGTGFFVASIPKVDAAGDQSKPEVFVATAAHVVSSGGTIAIQRQVDVDENESYIEAYPEVDVVAFDPDSDLALLRIHNLPGHKVRVLALGEAKKDEPISSWGFPSSSLVSQGRLGLTRKDGTISGIQNLPVYDRRDNRLLKDNATKGIIVSTTLEPGFSGGPTVNARGEVVGVNALKDLRHEQQNAAIHVDLLRNMIESVQPYSPPTIEEVAKLLNDTYGTFFSYSKEGREEIREEDFLALSELPILLDYVKIIRQVTGAEGAGANDMSVAASVGMVLMNLPSRSLETFLSKDHFGECEDRLQKLGEFFKGIGDSIDLDSTLDSCLERGIRPLMWDLMASTLRWTGNAAQLIRVTGLEEVDANIHLYKATAIREGSGTAPFSVYVSRDYGRLRVRLFEVGENHQLNVLKGLATVSPEQLNGIWKRTAPRAALPNLNGAEIETEETLSVAVDGAFVNARHVVKSVLYAPAGQVFSGCYSGKTWEEDTQKISGKLEGGILLMTPQGSIERKGNARSCVGMELYSMDKLVTLKMVGDKLIMYRTSGPEFPESQEFSRVD